MTATDDVRIIKITPLQHLAAEVYIELSTILGEEPDSEIVAMANAMTVSQYEALQKEPDPSAE